MAADPNDPLDKASDALGDLKHADDWDEITERHEQPVIVNNHFAMPSQPDTEPEQSAKDVPNNEVAKDVSLLAKLLPPEHRIYFICLATIVGGVLLALSQGWL